MMSDVGPSNSSPVQNELTGQEIPEVLKGFTDPFVGKTIGNCEIIEKINEGGTSYIYRAHNTRFDLDRVVKILKPSLLDDQEFFMRFKQEAQLIARLDHPHILRVFDTGQVGGFFYIEMEHLAGVTLREHIQANPKLNEPELLSIASQIISALEYAHKVTIADSGNTEIHGILHRDLKPENIMLTPGKLVKLMDFGAAKPLNITSNTMQGMIVGTFHYMSPEQLAGQNLDVRSDFFSLGIVLYEMATGQKPFSADNLTDLINAIKQCKYPRVRSIRRSISPLTEELIDKLLSRDLDHRPSTAHEVSQLIQHCIKSYEKWGAGKKVMIPYSIKRHFPFFSFVISCIALVISIIGLKNGGSLEKFTPKFQESVSIPLLEQGRSFENKQEWDEAIKSYKMVPSIEKGGLANEYLEAQIRMAAIMIENQQKFTKARKILEDLRTRYSDPAVDAYLGRVYYQMGLYKEAQERFEIALKSSTGSVIPQTGEFKRNIFFYSASALDGKYQKEEQNAAYRIEAIKAWDYFLTFAECSKIPNDLNCEYAFKRKTMLTDLEKRAAK